jgi:hypothetical protein
VGLELLGGLVTSSGGLLHLEAAPGRGAELSVRLPLGVTSRGRVSSPCSTTQPEPAADGRASLREGVSPGGREDGARRRRQQ